MPDDTVKYVEPAGVIKAISPHPAAVNERRRGREEGQGSQREKKKKKERGRKDRVTITAARDGAQAEAGASGLPAGMVPGAGAGYGRPPEGQAGSRKGPEADTRKKIEDRSEKENPKNITPRIDIRI